MRLKGRACDKLVPGWRQRGYPPRASPTTSESLEFALRTREAATVARNQATGRADEVGEFIRPRSRANLPHVVMENK